MFTLYAFTTHFFMPHRSSWRKGKKVEQKNTLWFHAASAGELEVLIPIIDEAVSQNRAVCVSIFSKSAESWLKRLPDSLLFKGFSPLEGEWESALEHYGVSEIITSKYEAWPGMWRAASRLGIRINIVCAQMRSSLKWAKRSLKLFFSSLPRLRFFVLDAEHISALKENFPQAECIVAADPRWVRVLKRAENAGTHPSLMKWMQRIRPYPKPFWVIGSAWKEDMDFLAAEIKKYPGTILVAPHSLSSVPDLNVFTPTSNCVLIDEMGMLVELYSIADRAWVGGGFGKGIHSTLEPSVYSIPVASGPQNVDKFFETKELREHRVLTICSTQDEIHQWLVCAPQKNNFSLKSKLENIQVMMRSIVS